MAELRGSLMDKMQPGWADMRRLGEAIEALPPHAPAEVRQRLQAEMDVLTICILMRIGALRVEPAHFQSINQIL